MTDDPCQPPLNPHWPAHLQPPPLAPAAEAVPEYPYSQPQMVQQPMYAPLVRPTSGMATASMILGIAGVLLFCLVIPSVVAVLLGHSALKETRSGHKGGHGQAVAGLILGYAVAGPVVVWLALGGFGALLSAIEGS